MYARASFADPFGTPTRLAKAPSACKFQGSAVAVNQAGDVVAAGCAGAGSYYSLSDPGAAFVYRKVAGN